MGKKIIKKSSTRHIRIIRLEPTHSLWHRLKHYIQELCFSEPIYVPADASLHTLFELLLQKGLFPFQDSISQIADSLKAIGCQVLVEPPLQQTVREHKNIYGSLMGTPYQGKCPDLMIDGKWFEHEGFITSNAKRAFSNMIARGLEQSDRIVIEDCGLNEGYMLRSINSRIIQEKNIKEVWIHTDDRTRVLYKKD